VDEAARKHLRVELLEHVAVIHVLEDRDLRPCLAASL
jgi:hypothetical protein